LLANTKITFFLLFDNILPIFESFQVKPKILIFEISFFLSKKFFFSKNRIIQILENIIWATQTLGALRALGDFEGFSIKLNF
jgi:hypothetical protein